MADDFASGTAAAAAGGNTMRSAIRAADQGHVAAGNASRITASAEGQCYIDIGFHLIITDPTPDVLGQELPALVKDGYTSFKVFMTYDDLVLSDRAAARGVRGRPPRAGARDGALRRATTPSAS